MCDKGCTNLDEDVNVGGSSTRARWIRMGLCMVVGGQRWVMHSGGGRWWGIENSEGNGRGVGIC